MERKVSNILLGIADSEDRFILKFGWFKFRLSIKPITAKRLIDISGEISKIRSIDETKEMFPALMESSSDLKYISNAISIATGTRFRRIVSHAILKLPLKDIQTLFNIVHKQSDPSPFFFTIILAKGRMNILKAKQE